MGVTERIRSAWSALTGPRATPVTHARTYHTSFVDAWIRGLDLLYSPLTGEQINQPYRQHSIVHRAIRAKVAALSRFQLEVYPDGADQDEPIEGHWLPDLIMAPDRMRRAGQLYDAIVVSLDSTGEAFLYHQDLRRGDGGINGRQRPHELWFLNPASMSPVTESGELVAWKWSSPDGAQTLSLEEVTFLRCENPYDPIRGLGSLEAAFLEYTGDHRAAVWNRSFFDHAAIPPIVFKTQDENGVWPEEERSEFLEGWNAKLQGSSRRGRAAALPGGIDVEVLKTTQQELDFIAGREQYREHILTALGVPPAVAGVPSSGAGNYQNYGQQRQQFHFDTMLPLAEFIARSLTVDLLDRYETGQVAIFKTEHVTAEITAEQFAGKVQVAKELWGMGVPFEDLNARLDLGFDTVGKPWLEDGWLPMGVSLASDLMEPPEDPPPALDPDTDTDPDDEEIEDPIEDVDDEERTLRAIPTKEKPRAALWRTYARRMGRGETRALRGWRRYLRWVERYVLDQLDQLDQQRSLTRGVEDVLFPAGPENEQAVRAFMRNAIEFVVGEGFSTIASEIGVTLDPSILDPLVSQLVAGRTQTIVGASSTVQETIRSAIIEGIEAGESTDQLAKRVRQRIQEQYTGQARTVARTESAAGFSQARHEAMQAHGVRRRQWLTARDARVRASHKIDGQTREFGEPFTLANGTRLLSPHADGAPAGEVVNCRCVAVPVVEDGA